MATSVTGLGRGSSEHMTLGVSKLIGPRWDEKKEETFAKLCNQYIDNATIMPGLVQHSMRQSRLLTILVASQVLTFIVLGVLALKVFL